MISSKKELNFYIKADRVIAGNSTNISFKERLKNTIFPDYISMYIRSMRYVAYYNNTNKKFRIKSLYHRWRFKRLGLKLGFSIGYNVFGYGLLIPHYGTIIVHGDTKAGNFCVLHTSTCIGGSGKEFGDALYLSSGSYVMGTKVKLDHNVSIATNSLVNKSVLQSNVLLVGNPAEIKKTIKPWYDDGDEFMQKVKFIEKYKIEIKL